jgi:hypothetical protein
MSENELSSGPDDLRSDRSDTSDEVASLADSDISQALDERMDEVLARGVSPEPVTTSEADIVDQIRGGYWSNLWRNRMEGAGGKNGLLCLKSVCSDTKSSES